MSKLDRAFVKAFDRRPPGGPHAPLARPEIESAPPVAVEQQIVIDPPVVEQSQIAIHRSLKWNWPRKSQAVMNATRRGFERLAGQLVDVAHERSLRSIGFVSPGRGHGRTTTLLALTQVLVEVHSPCVLLVDADVGHPEIASQLGVAPACGLFDVACGDATLEDAIVEMVPGRLGLLAECGSGHVGLWNSERYPAALTVLEMYRPQFGLVLVDVGPWGPMNWSSVWYRGAIDAVVCVASTRPDRQQMTDGQLVSQLVPAAIEYLGRIETSV
jgi:hypothetical protein